MEDKVKKSLKIVRLQHLMSKLIVVAVIALICGAIVFWRVDLKNRGFCALKLSEDKTSYTVVDIKAERKEYEIPSEYRGIPITTIGGKTFSYVSKLEKVILPNSVQTLGEEVFAYSSNLKEVVWGNNVTSIGKDSFIGTGIFKDESNWQDGVLYVGKYLIKARESGDNNKKVVIKDGTLGIADYAFSETSLEKVEFCSDLVFIGERAFANCDQLKGVDLVIGNIAKIGKNAFYGCGLTDVAISSKIIGEGMFSNCRHLKNLRMEEGLISIEANAFSYCYKIESVYLPDSLEQLGESAFNSCLGLKSVSMGKNLKLVESAFAWIQIENLYYRGNLEEYIKTNEQGKIPASNIYIDNKLLTNLVVPSTVLELGSVFSDYKGLRSVVISEGVTVVKDYALSDCESMVEVILPKSLTKIGRGAFSYCSSLKKIEIPDGITSIESSTFSGCSSLTSIVIPNSVKTIGNDALRECNSLQAIYFKGTSAEWKNISIGSNNDCLQYAITYYYIENAKDVPTDGGNYWHYDVNGLPVAW